VCWLAFLGRRARLACFVVVTILQIGIIATANYGFLNYIVLALGVLLVDDAWLARLGLGSREGEPGSRPSPAPTWRLAASAVPLTLVFYSTLVVFLLRGAPASFGWLLWPAEVIDPLRIANRYGLFAVMTPARYEIEFQGTTDGSTWQPYPFRYKPQDLDEAPGLYAPYQPRFEWNLWFASLGSWKNYTFVVRTEARLLEGSADVLALFARDPFQGARPKRVRAVISRYHFTDRETQRETGAWWTRERPVSYCPEVTLAEDGTVKMVGGS